MFVFANNGDFDAYAPRLARYVKGVEDDTIAAAVASLHELYAEVGRREARLAELGAKKVTRQLAQDHRDLRPIVALFSECHELFGHAEYGELAAELAVKTIERARKTGITLRFDTQSSRKEAIPPKLVELVSVNCCFYVKTWRSNDGFLGDGSSPRASGRPSCGPAGTAARSLITGVSDAQFELLRWYFVEVDDDTGYRRGGRGDRPRPWPASRRARPSRAAVPVPRSRRGTCSTTWTRCSATERVKLRDAVGLLRGLAPSWAPYRTDRRAAPRAARPPRASGS